MRVILILLSGAALYGFVRDAIPRIFIARIQYIYRLESETKKASVPKD